MIAIPHLRNWFLFALVIRVLASITVLRFAHPDSWFQTVEFANLLQNGYMSWALESEAHMRNLSLASFLRLPLILAKWLHPDHMWFRVFLVKLFVAMLDLSIIFMFIKTCIHTYKIHSPKFQNLFFACFLLPWFVLSDAVQSSMEHLSSLASLLVLICLLSDLKKRKTAFFLGLTLILVGAIRYPSILFSTGVLAALALKALWERKWNFNLSFLLLGLISGIFIFGVSDSIYYGRPWESFWMYLHYNLFTGIASLTFGEQSAIVYLKHLWVYFGKELSFFGLFVIPFGLLSTLQGLKKLEPWAWGLMFYILGHLIPEHKEGRFIQPIFVILVFAALIFTWNHREKWKVYLQGRVRKIVCTLAILTLIANTVHSVEVMRGELFKSRSEFFLVQDISLKEKPCGLIANYAASTYLRTHNKSPIIPTASFPTFDTDDIFHSIRWLDRKDSCAANDVIYIHTKSSKEWIDVGCTEKELYSSALLRGIARTLKGSKLYTCPASILAKFKSIEVEAFVKSIKPIHRIPKLNATPDEFFHSFSH